MTTEQGAMRRGDLGAWWWQGLRSSLLMPVQWQGLRVSPALVAWLVMVPTLLNLGLSRLYVSGQADFYYGALLFGWLGTLAGVWVSWLLIPGMRGADAEGPASAAHLFAMLAAQTLTITAVSCTFVVMVVRGLDSGAPQFQQQVYQYGYWVLLAWAAICQLALVWRVPGAHKPLQCIASVVLLAMAAAAVVFQGPSYWYAARSSTTQQPAVEPFRLTQELVELQAVLLQQKLQAIEPGPAGKVNVFAITFAPYAAEDVFQRESEMVAGVMQQRFGTQDRTIQLVNHAKTATAWPWATPLNLHRAIQRMAEVMDRERDILFIHLTSHGARNGQLSAEFSPLSVDFVTPAMLNAWLAEAGVRYRIISVSACYSGSWIAPLSDAGTLVMTAADADHTSYGCGRGSELTYFGRAMYAEQLRHTWSFEQAHSAARTVIDQREREAGKSDGYSNPQISVGEKMRGKLAQLAHERELGR